MMPPHQQTLPDPVTPVGANNMVFITEPWFDSLYLKTVPGIMKAIVIALNLLGFILIQSSAFWSNGRGVYFNIVAQLGLWFSTIILLCYMFHIVEKYHNIKWLKIELVAYVALTFLYLIASTIVVAFGSPAYSAAGFFGYLAMVVYGSDAFAKVRLLQSGAPAQGHCVTVKPQHVTSPA